MINIPNFLSVLRIIIAPFVVINILRDNLNTALLLFIIAGVTDLLDGYIARVFKFQTKLGVILDPFADKILMISTFITIAYVKIVPVWFALILITKDTLMIVIYFISRSLKLKSDIKATFWGKINTFNQLFLVAFLFLFSNEISGEHHNTIYTYALNILIIANLVTTFISAIKYLIIWMQINKINARM